MRRVTVWFGDHIVAEKTCPTPAAAAKYEDGMRRRFAALRVTNEPIAGPVSAR